MLGEELYSKVVITEGFGNTITAIDTEGKLPSGTYLIVATSKNEIYNMHLVIQ
jgi:translation initiation factor IF-2